MRTQLTIMLVLVVAGGSSAPAASTGMFCQSGEEWYEVASGELNSPGWSVVNFTKPEGGAMKVVWTLDDFDSGPTSILFGFGKEPGFVAGGAFIHRDDTTHHLQLDVNTSGVEMDQGVSLGRAPVGQETSGTSAITFGPTYEDNDTHIIQYAAGDDPDGWSLEWKLFVDNCLGDVTPSHVVSEGSSAELLSAEDMNGQVNIHGSAYAPGVPHDQPVFLVDNHVERQVHDQPFVTVWWQGHSGGIEMDGPGSLDLRDLSCFERSWNTWCFGWGDGYWWDLTPGSYSFTIDGFTDPTKEPTRESQGPYITVASTTFPGIQEGEGG